MTDIIIIILTILAALFSLIGVIGLFRLPDFYTRMHAAGLIGSFGLLFTAAAAIIYAITATINGAEGYLGFIFHILFAVILVIIAATTSTHIIARAAHRTGHTPKPAARDTLKEEQP